MTQTMNIVPLVHAAEPAPMVDTWILSDGGNQYYIKGGTLDFDAPTYAVRESEAYSFTAQIICVYPNGRYTVNHYNMYAKGTVVVSIDGGRFVSSPPGSIYDRLWNAVVDKYLK